MSPSYNESDLFRYLQSKLIHRENLPVRMSINQSYHNRVFELRLRVDDWGLHMELPYEYVEDFSYPTNNYVQYVIDNINRALRDYELAHPVMEYNYRPISGESIDMDRSIPIQSYLDAEYGPDPNSAIGLGYEEELGSLQKSSFLEERDNKTARYIDSLTPVETVTHVKYTKGNVIRIASYWDQSVFRRRFEGGYYNGITYVIDTYIKEFIEAFVSGTNVDKI